MVPQSITIARLALRVVGSSRISSRTNVARYLSTSVRLHDNASSSPVKVPIALIAELRKHNPISLSKAREALSKSSNSIPAALEWLESDLASSGSKKAAKVGGRETKNGLIGVVLMGTRAAMVEVNCETDFVGRNQMFRGLVEGICSTTAFSDSPGAEDGHSKDGKSRDPILAFPIQELLLAPVVPLEPRLPSAPPSTSSTSSSIFQSQSHDLHHPAPQTVSQAITSAITQTGENIQLRRAVSFASPLFLDEDSSSSSSSSSSTSTSRARRPFLLPGVYVHGATTASGNEGTVGGLVVLSITSDESDDTKTDVYARISKGDSLGGELQKMARSVARQVVGFHTEGIRAPLNLTEGGAEGEVSKYLFEQPFMMFQGEERTVGEVLRSWGQERGLEVDVVSIRRWGVGDGQ